jgi:hypothetical protein
MPCFRERFAARECWVIVAPQAVKIEGVSKVSTWRKAGVVARVAGQQVQGSRTFNALMGAARTTFRSFARAMHQLWLEVTGVIFLLMALSFAGATFKEYGKYHSGQAGPRRLELAIFCTVAFAWFGLSSFWKVRRKSSRP